MNILQNTLYLNQVPRGTCHQLGVSLKTGAIKYLFCETNAREQFAVNASAILAIEDFRVQLSSIRPVIPKNAVKLSIGLPVYAFTGVYLGEIKKIQRENMRVTALITDKNATIPFSAVLSCADAVILRKNLPYPLGQRIPAPALQLITRPVLKKAIAEKNLIKLTLSLAPFTLFN